MIAGTVCFLFLSLFYVLLWKQSKVVSCVAFLVFLPLWIAGAIETLALGGLLVVGGIHYLAFFVLCALSWFQL